jgi:diacylglycerol kinase (ATP)
MNTPATKKSGDVKAFLMGFVYAIKGVVYLFTSQRNARVHLFAAVLVVAGGFYFSISTTEWIAVVLSIGMVIAAEAFNSSIEELVDIVSPDYNKSAGRIKDLAAGAVLLIAIAAAVVGLVIFLPKIFGAVFF